MAFVKQLKVHRVKEPNVSLLLEHKNSKEFLWVESQCSIALNNFDGNHLKQNSSKVCDAYGCIGALLLSKGVDCPGYYLSLVNGCKSVGRILDCDVYRITDVLFVSLKNGIVESSSGASEMKRLLCSGSFYFLSSTSDVGRSSFFITQSLQSDAKEERDEFLWNRNMISYFSIQGIRCRSWFLYVMCGGVDIRTFYVGAQQGRVAVVNRLSCERVGTRYNVRGADDQGNVANFVESEQIINIGSNFSSFVMTRGSVPLFWEQPGLNVGSHKVKIPHCFEISSQAYNRHLEKLIASYSRCALVNLLGSKEGEASLSRSYQLHHEASGYGSEMPLINFDYHSECRAGKATNMTKLMGKLDPFLNQFSVMFSHGETGKQTGVLRMNCLDCLDRTNSVQTYVGLQMAVRQLSLLGHSDNNQILTRVVEPLKAIWQQTGDLISRMYAGTGALEGKDAVGKLKDGAKSLSRSFQNNFLDHGKQETMDTLLRIPFHSTDLHHLSRTLLTQKQFRKSSSSLLRNMCKRQVHFCDDVLLRICVATWNVNGGKLFRSIAYKDKTLKDWLHYDEQPSHATKSYYQAVYDYNSAEEGDLSLALNDFITVDYHLEDGEWLHGVKGHEEGIFPSSYVQQLANPHLVLHDFPAQQDGDLALWTNEVVDVIEANGEWVRGRVYRDGTPEEGSFPANFVEKVSEIGGDGVPPIDVYAIGFEEMVELNAGNIVSASQANQKEWAAELHKTLSELNEYVLITSEQLVGVCLFVFVRKPLVSAVRQVSLSTIKTGMGGTTGNKGAVAISMTIHNSSFCFVCSHFAAGQTQVMERNNDYEEISNRLSFAKGRSLFLHDYVFWCGDFNYRIDLSGDEVKELVKSTTWDKLRENDQLLIQKKMGNVFKDFLEGVVSFAPTYKYDLFSDDYDTSEKCRVPAWTDRVLWRRTRYHVDDSEDDNPAGIDCGRLICYGRTELKISDHRPVMALIEVTATRARDDDRERLHTDLMTSLQPINTPIYIHVEDSGCDPALSDRFIDSLKLGKPTLTRSFPSSYLVVLLEAWMVKEVLKHDGEAFEGRVLRISASDDFAPVENTPVPTGADVISETVSIEDFEVAGYSHAGGFPSSQSSGNLSALPSHVLTRPNSTPPLSIEHVVHPSPTSTPTTKKRPPRPPAISNVPPRPPAISSTFVPGAPPGGSSPEEESVNAGLRANGMPPRPPSFNAQPIKSSALHSSLSSEEEIPALKPTATSSVGSQQQPSADYSFPDLSNWMVAKKPPKIKPRKTVPKRRAPVPPKVQAPVLSPSKEPSAASLLEDVFGSTPAAAPLVPVQPLLPVGANPSSTAPIISAFDPFAPVSNITAPLNKPPPRPIRAAPTAPVKPAPPSTKDPFGDLMFPVSNTSDHAWPSSTSITPQTGKLNHSFTTDFSDFNFEKSTKS